MATFELPIPLHNADLKVLAQVLPEKLAIVIEKLVNKAQT